jgi:hypothetical protein
MQAAKAAATAIRGLKERGNELGLAVKPIGEYFAP